MVLFCVLLIGVGGCTSKAPFTSALAPASSANNYLCVTACEVAVCGCRGVTIVVPRLCVLSVPGRAPTVSLAPPPRVLPVLRPPGHQECASSSGSCELCVEALQLDAGDHTPPEARAGERRCVGLGA